MCYAYIFNSDWFIYEIISILPPYYLYTYRLVNKYLYNTLTNSKIEEVIIDRIKFSLKSRLDGKYDLFMNMIATRECIIYSSFINECIYGRESQATISIRMHYRNIEGLFDDINSINDEDDHCEFNMKNVDNFFQYDSYYEFRMSNKRNIHLYITDDDDLDDENCPLIFQNSISVVERKMILKISDIKLVISRKIDINLQDKGISHNDVILYKKYDMNINILPIDTFIYDGYIKYPIIKYDNKLVSVFGLYSDYKEDLITIYDDKSNNEYRVNMISRRKCGICILKLLCIEHFHTNINNMRAIAIRTDEELVCNNSNSVEFNWKDVLREDYDPDVEGW